MRGLQSKRNEIPRRGSLYNAVVISLSLTFAPLWVMGSFFDIDVFGSMIWFDDTAWCDAPDEGIGDHCFGDFNERVAPDYTDPIFPPYRSNMETTLVAPFLTPVLNYFSGLASPRAILVSWLFFMLAYSLASVLTTPASSFALKFKISAVVLFGGYPWLVAVDRLNYVLLACLPLVHLVSAASKSREKQTGILIVALACIKPHFLLLLLVFAAVRSWANFMRFLAIGLVAVTSLIILPAEAWMPRLRDYFAVTSDYGAFRGVSSTLGPPNASFVAWLFELRGLGIFWIQDSFIQILAFLLPATLCVLVVIFGTRTMDEALLVLIPIVFLGFGTYVASYYLLFSSILLVDALISETTGSSHLLVNMSTQQITVTSFFAWSALIVSQSLIIIPGPRLSEDVVRNLTPTLASCLWLAFIFLKIYRIIRSYVGTESVETIRG